MKSLSQGDLNKFGQEVSKKLAGIQDLDALKQLQKEVFGRSGSFRFFTNVLTKAPDAEKRLLGPMVYQLRSTLQRDFSRKQRELFKTRATAKTLPSRIDPTLPKVARSLGRPHPLLKVVNRIQDIFLSLGFDMTLTPEAESEFYNFDGLNIPEDHPARDLWDTFWLNTPRSKGRYLMRTHTSSMQVRYLETHKPPLRVVNAGRCYRYEATDRTHNDQFFQVDGLIIEKELSITNYIGLMRSFFEALFEKEVLVRLRPGYFPFVEPGFELDISCLLCGRKGCQVCKGSGWLEVMGAGMVHTRVFRAAKVDPEEWQGIAFGMGVDRIAMIAHGLQDIRWYYSLDRRL